MGNYNDQFEKNLQNSLKKESPFSAEELDWNGLQNKMKEKSKRRIIFWFSFITFGILSLGVVSYFLSTNSEHQENYNQTSVIIKKDDSISNSILSSSSTLSNQSNQVETTTNKNNISSVNDLNESTSEKAAPNIKINSTKRSANSSISAHKPTYSTTKKQDKLIAENTISILSENENTQIKQSIVSEKINKETVFSSDLNKINSTTILAIDRKTSKLGLGFKLEQVKIKPAKRGFIKAIEDVYESEKGNWLFGINVSTDYSFYSYGKKSGFESQVNRNFYQVMNNSISGGLSLYTGVYGGLRFNESIGLTLGVGYSTKAQSANYNYLIIDEPEFDANGNIVGYNNLNNGIKQTKSTTNHFNFIEVPLNLRFYKNYDRNVSVNYSAGLIGMFNLKNSILMPNEKTLTLSNFEDNKITNFAMAYQFGIGMTYRIKQNMHLMVQPNYKQTIGNLLQKESDYVFSIGTLGINTSIMWKL